MGDDLLAPDLHIDGLECEERRIYLKALPIHHNSHSLA